MVLRRMSNEVR